MLVQPNLGSEVLLRLPPGCGTLVGNIVKLGQRFNVLGQASRPWHQHFMQGMKCLGFESCAAAFENGMITVVVVVHVDDIFSMRKKSRCDQFSADLKLCVPISNLRIFP